MNTQKYKQQLLEERNKITNLITEMQDNTVFGNTTNHTGEKYSSGELSSYDNHLADMGTEVFMQDMQNSLTTHEKGKINEIDNALYKIDNGTYGVCDQCKNKIDEERLDILPETSLCSNCANHQPDMHLTSRDNQNLINKGDSFYDDVILELYEMNKAPNDESNLD